MSCTSRWKSAIPATAAVLIAPLLASCSTGGDDGDELPVPAPPEPVAAVCRALHDRLPTQVDGQQRITETQAAKTATTTAAWGEPAIRLRCGVPRPAVLVPGSERYNPTSEAVEVNGVDWLLEERGTGYRFTTTGREVFVELTVPDAYHPEVNALTDLAAAVRAAVPEAAEPLT